MVKSLYYHAINDSASLCTVMGSPEILYGDQMVENGLTFMHNEPDRPASIQLTCHVESHPTASISWSRNDSSEARGLQNISRFRYLTIGSYIHTSLPLYHI